MSAEVDFVNKKEVHLRTLKQSGHVGFDSLPDQLVNKSVQNGFVFNVMCIGVYIQMWVYVCICGIAQVCIYVCAVNQRREMCGIVMSALHTDSKPHKQYMTH